MGKTSLMSNLVGDAITPSIGFLHTADVHVATFERLLDGVAHDPLRTVHVVDETLLSSARELGADDTSVIDGVEEALRDLVDEGVDVIVCTCSTIGGIAEAAVGIAVPVLRGDRPMAADAVARGERIAVVAAVESTFGPTLALLGDECTRQGRSPVIEMRSCLGAWTLFEASDVDGYHRAVAAHVNGLDATFDVVVLAQPSMLGALTFLDDRPGRIVLASPSSAIDAAIIELHRVARTASPRGETS